jgi:hypothetical protein
MFHFGKLKSSQFQISTLHSTLEIQPATLFGEKCVRLYLLGYLSISVFTTQRIKEKDENLF